MTSEPNNISRPGPLVTWALALRPESLGASSIPIIVGIALAYRDLALVGRSDAFLWTPAICCLFFGVLLQIAANLINDYSDFKRGADSPDDPTLRVVASGWISPRATLVAFFIALALACLFGLGTIPYGGAKLIAIGAVCCVFCFIYSAGPAPMAYIGLGDPVVVACYGLIASGATYFLLTGALTADAALTGAAFGFVVDNILVTNNCRDIDSDREVKKRTLAVIFGARFGRALYFANGLIAVALLAAVFQRRGWTFLSIAALAIYFALHCGTSRTMGRLPSRELNRVMALSMRNLLVLGVLVACAFFM